MHKYEIEWRGMRFWIAAHDACDAERRVQAHLQAEGVVRSLQAEGVVRSAWEASVIETDAEEDPVLSSC